MIAENYSLLKNNTFGVDVSARYFFEYETKEELLCFLISDLAKKNRLMHIGGGSNLLFLSDFDGVILHSKIRTMEKVKETDADVFLRVGAGVVFDEFVDYCVEKGFGGLENLSSIPGEVGAAPVQNVGAYGVEAKDVVCEVETIEIETLRSCRFSNADCHFSYRNSIFKQSLKGRHVVTHVSFKLSKNPVFNIDYKNVRDELSAFGDVNLKTVRSAISKIRSEKLPDTKEIGSAGSFFMNPLVEKSLAEKLKSQYADMPIYPVSENLVKIPAGWLIEQCGWKGRILGNVGVYPKQALVLVNYGGASGLEIAALSEKICGSVLEIFGIKIKPEVIFV